MPSFGPYESEVAFLSGVTDTNTVAATSYYTWPENVPPSYGLESFAIKWGNATPGTSGGNVTYWFNDASNWSNTEKWVWQGAFAMWAGLADIDFALAADAASANISIIRGTDGGAFASFGPTPKVPVGGATIGTPSATGPLVSIDTNGRGFGPINDDPNEQGGYPYSTVIHEIGHILGLGHSGPYNSKVDVQQQQFGKYDTSLWSIMSYIYPTDTTTRYFADYTVTRTDWGKASDGSEYQPLTPMMLDILAIQRLYGVSGNSTYSGGQTYGFNSSFTGFLKSIYDFGTGFNTSAIVTLWNSGTGNALDLSLFTENATINLAPGSFSSAGGKVNNIAIALDTVIETAIGGGGNDTIVASDVASDLTGNAGNDTLTGGSAGDTLNGGDGNDILLGQGGNDRLFGTAGADTLKGGAGNDDLSGGVGDDVLAAGAGVDLLEGGAGNDIFQLARGESNGDTVTDFAGDGAGNADILQFFGYGLASQGATFTQVDATHWSINSSDGAVADVITIANGAAIAAGGYSFHPAYAELAKSTFLDFGSWRTNSDGPSSGVAITGPVTLNVALVLDRANDPTALLDGSWAARQDQLATLNNAGTLWSTYGADPAKYNAVLGELATLGIRTVDQVAAVNGYISSAESRTIWVQVTQDSFPTLFGPQAILMGGTAAGAGPWYWTGSLSLPQVLADAGVGGLWFDTAKFEPVLANPGTGPQATLAQGWQSLGNSSSRPTDLFPQQIARDYYKFPLPAGIATGTIGLVEPGVGTAMSGDNPGAGFQAAIDAYRTAAGIETSATVSLVAPGGQEYPTVVPPAFNPAGERSLDVGVVTAINPRSPLAIYAGSGTAAGAQHNAYTAYQSAFWDMANNPQVVTSSFGYTAQTAPGSPFYNASRGLFVDAALRNISVFNDNGDGGSGNQSGNGLTNVSTSRASPYAVMVGGTSLSTIAAAENDPSLAAIVQSALNGDEATIWRLIASGLTTSPIGASGGSAAAVEAVWNRYFLNGNAISNPVNGTGFIHNNTGSGGVDGSQPTPWYQAAFGLVPTTSDPDHLVGRGTPDVAANAGGNMFYRVPGADMTGLQNDDGTSAATPLWAALASQIDAIFADQGLPQLGYMNDLLYTAAVIAPGAFNDIQLGNNTSSFVLGGSFTSDGQSIAPTGYGYSAGAGYDLVSGLGTPNGLLLARTLTQIAHGQTSFAALPDLIDADGQGGWTSGVQQNLLIQASTNANTAVGVTLGTLGFDFTNELSGSFAWTARMAQQSLQSGFDAELVRLFDKHPQGMLVQGEVSAGANVSITVGAGQGYANQAGLSSAYGFADFATGSGVVHLARAVAVAETAGGQNDQNAVVRIRQGGEDNVAVSFYRVDDYSGKIGTLAPGDAGYAAAAAARAYTTVQGGTSVSGPGYGNYTQTELTQVDAGDLIAMQLANQTSGNVYWAFSQANEQIGGAAVAHLWNYGANTWGWEDLAGGGDRDYNDVVVQLDFTSATGQGWLV